MLHKLLGKKSEVFLVEPAGKLQVRYVAPDFVLDDGPLTAQSTAAHILEPFVEERKRLKKPLVAQWNGDQLEVVLERSLPDRVYRFRVHPSRRIVSWTEELTELPDPRLMRLEPSWSCSFSSPPWPAKPGQTSLSAAWLPEGLVFLLGDWVAWLDPETGKIRGEWPLPGKAGARATIELLTPVPQGVLGSYRVFEGERPVASGMLLLKLEEQPRWKLIPTRSGSLHTDNPVTPTEKRIVVETRVFAGEDYIPSRAQWVVDLSKNQSYTALLGGAPQDQAVERCLSLLPDLSNRLEFKFELGMAVGSNPFRKLTELPAFPTQDGSEVIRRGAFWPGFAVAYELRPDNLQLYGWHCADLDYAHCRACRQIVPAGVYHCPCGMPWKP